MHQIYKYASGLHPPLNLDDLIREADALHHAQSNPVSPLYIDPNSRKQSPDEETLAMFAQSTSDALMSLKASFHNVNHKLRQVSYQQQQFSSRPDFYFTKPSDPQEVKTWNNKSWMWCEPCGHWTTTHATNYVNDNFPAHSSPPRYNNNYRQHNGGQHY
jgi:hypothetical protein